MDIVKVYCMYFNSLIDRSANSLIAMYPDLNTIVPVQLGRINSDGQVEGLLRIFQFAN